MRSLALLRSVSLSLSPRSRSLQHVQPKGNNKAVGGSLSQQQQQQQQWHPIGDARSSCCSSLPAWLAVGTTVPHSARASAWLTLASLGRHEASRLGSSRSSSRRIRNSVRFEQTTKTKLARAVKPATKRIYIVFYNGTKTNTTKRVNRKLFVCVSVCERVRIIIEEVGNFQAGITHEVQFYWRRAVKLFLEFRFRFRFPRIRGPCRSCSINGTFCQKGAPHFFH